MADVPREQQGAAVEPGIIARLVEGVRYAITGVAPTNFFGPQQPMKPLAQEEAQGRQFDYPVGWNLRYTPRGGEAIGFAQLRGLADNYDLLRLAIETRKDQIESYDWEIVENEDAEGPRKRAEKRDLLLHDQKVKVAEDKRQKQADSLAALRLSQEQTSSGNVAKAEPNVFQLKQKAHDDVKEEPTADVMAGQEEADNDVFKMDAKTQADID